jgi:hypothetical protein
MQRHEYCTHRSEEALPDWIVVDKRIMRNASNRSVLAKSNLRKCVVQPLHRERHIIRLTTNVVRCEYIARGRVQDAACDH